ncbi:MAG: UDP-4-amino-4,6-dideoxy-N-acetyl-beta-L-altrosamine transaminase [Acinetobacter sp.]|uniref:UDP-4-amino-4, 6-dideoxy-N-acetyl-beta-L-altrosamine transaminase n=1 Tax=Acinetobacter sp. TaxID=472 RepID=UPI00261EB50C|nr:UDP-4-amino-4,6-dideoxy-N-acetyl-beta-L-altrosamine transaminase [Acinetobacter sp.]MDD2945820.1 UDP-4-amino-4,6-dideoxy-N-acetyl-beta-L-altrosamine transaminase [Acinetobacter sp.]
MIPYGRQTISEDDVEAVVTVLKSDFLTQGPVVPQFEQEIANYCDAKYAVAVNSATSALHIACLALGVQEGDYVWTTPNTFVASANCARYCGATVDFVDIDPDTFNLCPFELEKKLKEAEIKGCLPKVVIPVHFSGLSCDMEKIHALSQKYHFRIIEDASHAIGGRYKETIIGCGKYSDITVFSFHPVKIITTAEGGMAVTNNSHLAREMQLLRSHGITRETEELVHESHGAWYYEQQQLGFNYRMTEMQAALGVTQLKHLNEWVAKRHELAQRYDQLLADLPVILPIHSQEHYSGLHLYVIRLDEKKTNLDRKYVFNELRRLGIGVNVHYIPVHIQPDYQKLGFQLGDFPKSEYYYQHCISLPLFATLTYDQQDQVVNTLAQILLGQHS